jgi:phosphate transport system substrate-binding protein
MPAGDTCSMMIIRRLIFLLLFLPACTEKSGILRIKGSDTELNVSVLLCEALYETKPNMRISVSGGGTGLGIAALMNNLAVIANASRPINEEESTFLAEAGIPIDTFLFAWDALAFIVHQDLPLDTLSVQQLAAIFSGTSDNWSRFGLPAKPITIYGRQNNSGTHGYLRQRLGIVFSSAARQMNGNAQIIESVKQDVSGIGYVGAGYVVQEGKLTGTGYKILHIKQGNAPASSPMRVESVTNGSYPFRRPLFQYIQREAREEVAPLIEFQRSAKGAAILRANGYFPYQDTL